MTVRLSEKISNKGFTLIEVVISVSIMSMLIVGALTVLSFGQKSFFAIGSQNEAQTLAYQISSTISAQVRKSSKIVDIQSTHLSIDDNKGNSVTFMMDPLQNTLLQIDGAGGVKTLATGVKSINFAANGSKGVQMTIELEKKSQVYRFSTTIFRRY